MRLRFIAALVGIFGCAAPALAMDFAGPLIQSTTPDKSRYKSGEVATVPIKLRNQTGSPYSGNVTVTVQSGRGPQVGQKIVVPVGTLNAGATQTIAVKIPLPVGQDYRGYLVAISAANQSGTLVDSAATALDESSDWAKYARECFVTHSQASDDTAALVEGLRSLHCNVLQHYKVIAEHQTPYSPDRQWQSLENAAVDGATVRAYVARGHQSGMASLVYTLWNGAYPNSLSDGSGVSPTWGLFSKNCAPNCNIGDFDATPMNGASFPSDSSLFPSQWRARYLIEMNPNNGDWRSYWLANNRPLLRFGFDGFQIDTLGAPAAAYDYLGNPVDLSTSLSSFSNAALGFMNTRGIINNVSRWYEADVAANSIEDFLYSEIHPEFGDTPFYPSLNGIASAIRAITSKAINIALYMNEDAANACPGGAQNCFANEPGLRYADAMILAAGAHHAYLADGDRILTNIYAPGTMMALRPATMQALVDLQTFGVAYEKLLRNVVYDAPQPASVTNGACAYGSPVGAAGNVYTLPKARPGFQILHLLNFCQLSSIQNQDRAGTYPAPNGFVNVSVKMYYAGAVTGANRLWFASPDVNHGSAQTLPYTKGSDVMGTFIAFTVPSLRYWDMFWLELDTLASSDYATP